MPFNPKWEQEWLKVVVPGCKASRFRGSADHPRLDREADYSLEYFLIGLMLDRWPKPLPESWIKTLDKLVKEDNKPKETKPKDNKAKLLAMIKSQKTYQGFQTNPCQKTRRL